MNSNKIYILLLFITLSASAQFTRVHYKTAKYGSVDSTKLKEIENKKSKLLSVEEQKLLEQVIKVYSEAEFELVFDKKTSVFSNIQKLEKDDALAKMNNLLNYSKYYKDIEKKEKLYQTEVGQMYNVIVPFEQYKWEITKEFKTINGYKCFKATIVKEDIYNPIKKSKATFNPVVWFAPELPASFGPQGLDGLPGLVLEATMGGKKYLYATKIEFNVKDIDTLKRPKGKDITEKDLENIFIEKHKKEGGE